MYKEQYNTIINIDITDKNIIQKKELIIDIIGAIQYMNNNNNVLKKIIILDIIIILFIMLLFIFK